MTPASLAALGDERFVSLTTFRRSGAPVATPVWIAAHDGGLVVFTTGATGKVKRLRRDPRVELRPCSRRGRVAPDAPVAAGTVTIEERPAEVVAGTRAIHAKYGWEYSVVGMIERARRRGRHADRVILRISEPAGRAADPPPSPPPTPD